MTWHDRPSTGPYKQLLQTGMQRTACHPDASTWWGRETKTQENIDDISTNVSVFLFSIPKMCWIILKDKEVINTTTDLANKPNHELCFTIVLIIIRWRCVMCTLLKEIDFERSYKPFIQVFNFEHGLLFGEMNCLQVSAMHSVVMPLLELSFRSPAPTPVLQVTQGSRYWQQYHTHCEPTHWQTKSYWQKLKNSSFKTSTWMMYIYEWLNLPLSIVQKKTLRNTQTRREYTGIFQLK